MEKNIQTNSLARYNCFCFDVQNFYPQPGDVLAGDAPRQKMNVRVPMDCKFF